VTFPGVILLHYPFPPVDVSVWSTQVLFPSSVGYAKFLIKKRQVIVK